MNCVCVLHESRKEEVLKVFVISNVDHVFVNLKYYDATIAPIASTYSAILVFLSPFSPPSANNIHRFVKREVM
jgi:hypothetical protein